MIEWLQDRTELDRIQERNKDLLVLFFYADFSDAAKRALAQIEDFKSNYNKIPIYGIDVTKLRGVHKEFGVTNVPTVVALQRGKDAEKIEGVQSAQFYARRIAGAHPVYRKTSSGNTSPTAAPRVVVYSTPTCPACNSAKAYFRRKGVRFRDIDVSRDQQAAESLMRRSGQMAVPQIDINGQLIVGFDQAKIDRLLFH